ncbi:complex I subunit 5 family protein [Liberiplasma polymorphum]|uniref:complex I subunit 5 family protein n=1 Tax=Liberiplasma polymorphum TaxID=3374570 RepID=UPI003773FEBB
MQLIPVFLVFIPIFTALFIYLFKNKHMNYLAFIAQFAMTVLAIIYYAYYQGNYEATFFVFGGWDASVGISFYNDSLSYSFVFLTLFSWWMVLIYTFDTKQTEHNFLFFLMFLQGVFLGLLQTNDLFNMFVFLELTTIIVTILIAFKKLGHSFRAAIYYLLINTSGVLLFLIGIIILYNIFGTINMRFIQENIAIYGDRNAIRFAYVLMMAGISVKSAFFPVFTWLPKAHGVAQSAISALLSGLVVKGGLYLFIRINEMFGGANINYYQFFYFVGAATAVVGVMFALSQKDMKQILAYHTVSQIGIVMMGLSSMNETTFYGGLLHIFNHALFKSLLFLGAGMIIKAYKTKKVGEIRGVMRTMPAVSIFMIIGMLSITGAPFFNGFISKQIIKYGIQDVGYKYWILFIVNIGTATSFIKMSQIFFGKQTMTIRVRKITENLTLMFLAFGCVILGNFYIPISNGFFGIDLSNFTAANWGAIYDYVLALTVGLCFYKLVIEKDYRPVRKIREFQMSFESANYLFMLYVVVMTLYFVVF